MSRRVIMRIEITQSAKDLLTDLCHRNGMTQVSVMSRMTEWFTAQSELIQAAVLRQYPPDISADVARLILRKMSNPDGKDGIAKDSRESKQR